MDVSFVPMSAVQEGSGVLDAAATRVWGEIARKSYTTFGEGDVLFAKITPCMENGKVAIARGLTNQAGAGSTEFHVIRCGDGVNPGYVLHYLLQNAIRREAKATMYGAVGHLRVSVDFMATLPLPLPPLAEQHRIVAEIEKQFTRLDAAMGALERVRANLRRYRAATLAAACTGRLVPTEAALNQPEPFEGSPPGWTLKAVGEFAAIQGGIQKQPKRAPADNAFPYLRVANVLRGKLDLESVHKMQLFGGELDRLRLEPGDLLVVEGNGSPSEIGRMARWDGSIENCVHQNHIIRVRCRSAEALPQYVSFYWNSISGKDQVVQVASSTSGLHTLSVAKVSRLKVPLPPLAEQHRIVAEVERRLSLVEKLEAVVADSMKRGTSLRQSILKRAFAGELVPQDPADEPASVLLERIRAERAEAAANGQRPPRSQRKARA